jgi:hypothetical protein
MYHEIFLFNLKYVILISKTIGKWDLWFLGGFGREDFDSTTKVLRFQDISICHWVIYFLIVNIEFYVYNISYIPWSS